jgi:hypothetical protein
MDNLHKDCKAMAIASTVACDLAIRDKVLLQYLGIPQSPVAKVLRQIVDNHIVRIEHYGSWGGEEATVLSDPNWWETHIIFRPDGVIFRGDSYDLAGMTVHHTFIDPSLGSWHPEGIVHILYIVERCGELYWEKYTRVVER